MNDDNNFDVDMESRRNILSVGDLLPACSLSPDNWDSMIQKYLKKR